ncbi:hypothetical protein P153DRAFT_394854 [Dothidotthia symphoricarpi CBS 119687]|uniref:Queuosine 5'-phosphate N-glycosylase/hydrolase n=1 Tax=Dothidotthia symphoricarpi CBS 119687 TaxID=1392245 RepID=A0A6A6AK91_9PLEO|nr:uncharacterized protein P153DRAFT_394854 [Dothidotthia symphoricarpi CBS 119687]KAF2131528.1 hypothetical protein P153DRAFT_394854 [Dothidotthia symphoricarpi CBS 119687]
MSDDEVDLELLDLLRKRFGIGVTDSGPSETKVLQDAEFIYSNSVDVAIDMRSTKLTAQSILTEMETREYSTKTWSEHELHPKAKDEATVNFIFTMDLLNFSFWSEKNEEERFAVTYKGKRWTGYWSLVAMLQRALDEGIPITSPEFWTDEDKCTNEVLLNVFRSDTQEQVSMFDERVRCLREAGQILEEEFDSSVVTLIEDAKHSAAGLANLLASKFPCFRDEGVFERRKVRFLKRAQIFVADLWAAFDGESYGDFNDVDKITMFADYRVPQILHSQGVLWYCPPLENRIRRLEPLESGHAWEMQIRGCSIWAVELLRCEILKVKPDANVNAILIDFFLYDLAKERESEGKEAIPHHRTRCIWY